MDQNRSSDAVITPRRPVVLLVDDHVDLLANLRGWLRESGYVTLTAPTGEKALAILQQIAVDVVVTDLEMPGMSGLALIDLIQDLPTPVPVLVLTGHATVENAVAALRRGRAFDFLQKPMRDLNRLNAAIDAAMAAPARGPANRGVPVLTKLERAARFQALTIRERELMYCLAQGFENKDIAQYLGISEKTVRNHLTHIYEKLGVASRTQAVILYQEFGRTQR